MLISNNWTSFSYSTIPADLAQWIVVNGLSPDITLISNCAFFNIDITSAVSGFNEFSNMNNPTKVKPDSNYSLYIVII